MTCGVERTRSLRASPEFRARLSAAVKGKRLGVKLSAACRAKLSVRAKERWASPEFRAYMSEERQARGIFRGV